MSISRFAAVLMALPSMALSQSVPTYSPTNGPGFVTFKTFEGTSCSLNATYQYGYGTDVCIISYNSENQAAGSVKASCEGWFCHDYESLEIFSLKCFSENISGADAVFNTYSDTACIDLIASETVPTNLCIDIEGFAYGQSVNALCTVGPRVPVNFDAVLFRRV